MIPIKYTYRNLFERRGVAFMTLASIGFVVLVYIGVLALAGGLRAVAQARLDSLDAKTDSLDVLNPFVESWCRAGAEELAPLRAESEIIPQWVSTVLLSLSRES